MGIEHVREVVYFLLFLSFRLFFIITKSPKNMSFSHSICNVLAFPFLFLLQHSHLTNDTHTRLLMFLSPYSSYASTPFLSPITILQLCIVTHAMLFSLLRILPHDSLLWFWSFCYDSSPSPFISFVPMMTNSPHGFYHVIGSFGWHNTALGTAFVDGHGWIKYMLLHWLVHFQQMLRSISHYRNLLCI